MTEIPDQGARARSPDIAPGALQSTSGLEMRAEPQNFALLSGDIIRQSRVPIQVVR